MRSQYLQSKGYREQSKYYIHFDPSFTVSRLRFFLTLNTSKAWPHRKMDAVISQIHILAQSADDAGRLEIQRALRGVQMEIQSPQDTLMEFANSVRVEIVYCILRPVTDRYRVFSLPCSVSV